GSPGCARATCANTDAGGRGLQRRRYTRGLPRRSPALTVSARPDCTLFRDLDGARLCPGGSVACIGAFDGLHRRQQAPAGKTVERARALGVPAVALTFEPLPREHFARGAKPPRLTLARNKVEGLHALGVDLVGLLRFNDALAAMSAEDFVQRLLVDRLAVREVWVGPGFRFGKGRTGDLDVLRALGETHGFSADEVATVMDGSERVSSTRIREALVAGDFATAERLLGRPYAIAGCVVHGRQLGRALGYPTANLRHARRSPALSGIFAGRVHGVEAQPWPSVISFGTRPTVDGGGEPLLEAHLFDFRGDLYGHRITIEFVTRLRDEVKFDGLPELVAQMHRDAAAARAALKQADTAMHSDSTPPDKTQATA